jgi:hypothetical protein
MHLQQNLFQQAVREALALIKALPHLPRLDLCRFKPELWKWEESGDAVRSYALFLGILAAGMLPQAAAASWADLPYFIGLACMTIYIGAHKGLNARQRQQITLKQVGLAQKQKRQQQQVFE